MPSEAVILALVTAVTTIAVAWLKTRPSVRAPRQPDKPLPKPKRVKHPKKVTKRSAKRQAAQRARSNRRR